MVKLRTIDDFTPVLLQFCHPGHLTPSEAVRLTLILVEELSDQIIDNYFLKFISRFLTKELYSDIVQERNISKLCGYPLCSEKPQRSAGTSNWTNVSPYSYLNSYCSKNHYQNSEFYKIQLSDEAVFARKNITFEGYGMEKYERGITLLEEAMEKYQSTTDVSLIEVMRDLDALQLVNNKEEEMNDMNKLLQDIKIVEKNPKGPDDGADLDLEDEDIVDSKKYEYLKDQSKAINGNRLK